MNKVTAFLVVLAFSGAVALLLPKVIFMVFDVLCDWFRCNRV